MKNIFRVIGFGLALIAFGTLSGYAQTNPCDDEYEVKDGEYQKFRTAIRGDLTLEKLRTALQVGKGYAEKYKDCDDTKDVVKYINGKLPAIQKEHDRLDRYDRFDKASKAKNWNDLFSVGKEIIAAEPAEPISLDAALALATVGFDRATIDKVDTFNGDTISMAELAIRKLESGMTSTNYGVPGIGVYKTKDYADGKENSLGWMNYTIGFIKYVRQKNTKDALPYLYKAATKYNSFTKKISPIYEMIAVYYTDELIKIDTKRNELIAANGNKDNDETLAMWNLERGYIERAIDAYARARAIAPDADKARIYNEIKELYQSSFKKTDGIDTYIASLTSKPFVDPMTAVQPVKEETPATTTTTATSSTTTTTTDSSTTAKPTTNSTNTAKPTSTTNSTTKPATTTKPTSSTTTPKKTTTVKKKSSR